MIEAAVQKRFGEFSLDAAISEGGFICLAGRNGSGKTTLLRIIAGLTKPDGGHVKINGRDVTGLPLEKRGVVMVTPRVLHPQHAGRRTPPVGCQVEGGRGRKGEA